MPHTFYRTFGKRLFDLSLVIPAILVVGPILAALALLVRIRLGSPVLFRQERSGRDGRPFTLCKFRTMTDACDAAGELLPDEQRLPTLGRRLRSSSLDELPEFWNILRGEMSLVGPRPLPVRYLPRYTPEQARRHDTRPGLTGWAQVNGRNAIGWEEKFALDVWYVNHCSLVLDIKILLLTVSKVLNRADISADGHATAPEFMGTAEITDSAGSLLADTPDQTTGTIPVSAQVSRERRAA